MDGDWVWKVGWVKAREETDYRGGEEPIGQGGFKILLRSPKNRVFLGPRGFPFIWTGLGWG